MIIASHRDDTPQDLLTQMYSLRANAFGHRRGWRVEIEDNLEIDKFDKLNPLYIMCVDNDENLLASLRLLQTTGPHMLADVFKEVIEDEGPVRNPLVLESTRFCVDTKASKVYAENGVNAVTSELLQGLFTVCNKAGIVNVISVFDLYLKRILARSGCIFEPYGKVVAYDGGLKTMAAIFETTNEAIENIASRSAQRDPMVFDGSFSDQIGLSNSRVA